MAFIFKTVSLTSNRSNLCPMSLYQVGPKFLQVFTTFNIRQRQSASFPHYVRKAYKLQRVPLRNFSALRDKKFDKKSRYTELVPTHDVLQINVPFPPLKALILTVASSSAHSGTNGPRWLCRWKRVRSTLTIEVFVHSENLPFSSSSCQGQVITLGVSLALS